MDLVPPHLIVRRYFASQKAAVDDLAPAPSRRHARRGVRRRARRRGWSALGAIDDDKVTKKSVAARLKEAKAEDAEVDEIEALKHVIELFKDETAAKKAAKEAQQKLDASTLKKYGDLSEADMQTLVLDDKWHGTVAQGVVDELQSVVDALSSRVRDLGARYAETVGELEAQLERLSVLVDAHLAALGVT